MDEVSGKTQTNAIFTKYSHHLNVSVFYVTQNLFNKKQREMSLNSQYFFLFKNPRNGAFISHLGRQIYPNESGFLKESYEDATQKQFSFLTVDMRQETDPKVRVIGGFITKSMFAYSL